MVANITSESRKYDKGGGHGEYRRKLLNLDEVLVLGLVITLK